MVLEAKFGQHYIQCCEKLKKLALSIGLFSYFTSEIKQKVVIAQTHAWKFQANLAKFFPDLGQK